MVPYLASKSTHSARAATPPQRPRASTTVSAHSSALERWQGCGGGREEGGVRRARRGARQRARKTPAPRLRAQRACSKNRPRPVDSLIHSVLAAVHHTAARSAMSTSQRAACAAPAALSGAGAGTDAGTASSHSADRGSGHSRARARGSAHSSQAKNSDHSKKSAAVCAGGTSQNALVERSDGRSAPGRTSGNARDSNASSAAGHCDAAIPGLD